MSKPRVSVVILTYRSAADALALLTGFTGVRYAPLDIVAVDNASPDETACTLRESLNGQAPPASQEPFEGLPATSWTLPGAEIPVTLIENQKNAGYAGGNNIGIRFALTHGAEFVLIINPDVTVTPDFLEKLVSAADARPKAGFLGPRILLADRKTIYSNGGYLRRWGIEGRLNDYGKPVGNAKEIGSFPTEYVTGTCVLARRSLLENVGLMREDYFLYCEDTDWNLRARKAGWECVIVPSAVVYHKESASVGKFSYRYLYYLQRNGLFLGWRHGGIRQKCMVLALSVLIFVKQPVKLLAMPSKRRWAKPLMRAVFDFWRGKTGPL